MSTTLFLSPDTWDLVIDAQGNIAVADDPWSAAQDVASALKTYRGECTYDPVRGMPYRESILGKRPPLSLVKQAAVTEALSVSSVVQAQAFITGADRRTVRGEVQVITEDGAAMGVKF